MFIVSCSPAMKWPHSTCSSEWLDSYMLIQLQQTCKLGAKGDSKKTFCIDHLRGWKYLPTLLFTKEHFRVLEQFEPLVYGEKNNKTWELFVLDHRFFLLFVIAHSTFHPEWVICTRLLRTLADNLTRLLRFTEKRCEFFRSLLLVWAE